MTTHFISKANSRSLLVAALILPLFFTACRKSSETKDTDSLQQQIAILRNAAGNIQVQFPQQDPGAPFYLRVGNILNQFFVTDGWLVIPFYRTPSCVRTDFNLLTIFDVPAAFSCPLTVSGSYIIERDAPLGTFPLMVQSTGTNVPFWFVRWTDFQAAAADGVVTIGELQSLNPLTGVADKFKETLRPRMENHLVQINASGNLNDGRKFSFHVTHIGDQTASINLTME